MNYCCFHAPKTRESAPVPAPVKSVAPAAAAAAAAAPSRPWDYLAPRPGPEGTHPVVAKPAPARPTVAAMRQPTPMPRATRAVVPSTDSAASNAALWSSMTAPSCVPAPSGHGHHHHTPSHHTPSHDSSSGHHTPSYDHGASHSHACHDTSSSYTCDTSSYSAF